MKMIAEVGIHHQNSLSLALEYVKEASKAGCWGVKFQYYQAASLASKTAKAYWDTDYTQYEVFKDTENTMSMQDWKTIQGACIEKGMEFIISLFNPYDISKFVNIGCQNFKIASSDCTFEPLYLEYSRVSYIRHLFISVGATDATDMDKIKGFLDRYGFSNRATLFHCPLAYPATLEDANLSRILSLKRNGKVGYSDHLYPMCFEEIIPILVTLGVTYCEKHFSLEPVGVISEDHYHSMRPNDCKYYAQRIVECKGILGSGNHVIMPQEIKARLLARRKAVALTNIDEGDIIQAGANVHFVRHHAGVDYDRYMIMYEGSKAYRKILEGEIIQ